MSYTIRLYRKGMVSNAPVYYKYEEDISYNYKSMLEHIFGENHLFKWNHKPVQEILEHIEQNDIKETTFKPSKEDIYLFDYGTLANFIEHIYSYAADDGAENVYLEIS